MLMNPYRLSATLRWSLVTTLRDRVFRLLAESQSWEKETPHLTTVARHDAQESKVLYQHRLIFGVALCLAFGTCHVLDHQEAEVGLLSVGAGERSSVGTNGNGNRRAKCLGLAMFHCPHRLALASGPTVSRSNGPTLRGH